MLETSNFVHRSAMRSLSPVMSVCSLSGCGQCHVSNFYIVDLENFRHSKSSVYRWYTQLDRRWFVYDTYKTMKATRTHHGWVHMFTTHRPTLTLQLHKFITSICSGLVILHCCMATGKISTDITRSLGNSWASCTFLVPAYPDCHGKDAAIKHLMANLYQAAAAE